MRLSYLLVIGILLVPSAAASAEKTPAFNEDVLPILEKYCVACHFGDEGEAELGLESYEGLMQGGKRGAIVTPGHAALSRMIRMMTGESEPKMPPDDNEPPTPEEISVLQAWIDAGAKGPEGNAPDPTILLTPEIPLQGPAREAITAVAVSPQGDCVAVAEYGKVELQSLPERSPLQTLRDHRGNVNAVAFSRDGQLLVAAAGEAGLFGEAQIWRVSDGQLLQTVTGHSDSLYAAELSPDGRILATAGYDQTIELWDASSGEPLRTLEGHNGPVFDLAFHPSGRLLASASGDRTVKIWSVADGARLDTLNQSLQELYTVAFSPDGQELITGGVDNRIRVYRIGSSGMEGSNLLRDSRYAHEAAVLNIAYSPNGKTIVTTGEDRRVKIWDAQTMRLREILPAQPDWTSGIAIAPDNRTLLVGRMNGSIGVYQMSRPTTAEDVTSDPLPELPPAVAPDTTAADLHVQAESEPNDLLLEATALRLPAQATGRIHNARDQDDVDLYRFDAKQGEQWIIETRAEQVGSPLDTKLEVLDAGGHPVERLLLRAVRDSELEFRGMDSDQRGARVKYWEEMLLNQYIYLNGEVIKLYQQRRGPDSDAQFYPEDGKRFSYFGTSPRAHALGQPAYVVVPYPLDADLPDNGLPVFTMYYENDDDGRRRLGRDSQLTFVAPANGTYIIRVTDVRGFGGDNYEYQLIVRRPRPDFDVEVPTIKELNGGSGKSFTIKASRLDNFNAPIRVDISGAPSGFQITSPITIEQGQLHAEGVVNVLASTPKGEADWSQLKVTASASIGGQEVTKQIKGNLGALKVIDPPKLLVHLLPVDAELPSTAERAEFPSAPPAIVLKPGARTPCQLIVERSDFAERIQFEIKNLPHGVIVDDIGLNGVLIPEGQSQRTIFLAAEPWVEETQRSFHAVATVDGNQASLPMILHVGEGNGK